jgi:hypothetical protein
MSVIEESNSQPQTQPESTEVLVGIPAGDIMKSKSPVDWPSDAVLRRYTGGCHCGKYTYEVSHPLFGVKSDDGEPIVPIVTCNCSICTHSGGRYM